MSTFYQSYTQINSDIDSKSKELDEKRKNCSNETEKQLLLEERAEYEEQCEEMDEEEYDVEIKQQLNEEEVDVEIKQQLNEEEVDEILEEMETWSINMEKYDDDEEDEKDIECLKRSLNIIDHRNLNYSLVFLKDSNNPHIVELSNKLEIALANIKEIEQEMKDNIEHGILKNRLLKLRYDENYISGFNGVKTDDIHHMARDKLLNYLLYCEPI